MRSLNKSYDKMLQPLRNSKGSKRKHFADITHHEPYNKKVIPQISFASTKKICKKRIDGENFSKAR